jgi:sulfite exporter TauE/SafE
MGMCGVILDPPGVPGAAQWQRVARTLGGRAASYALAGAVAGLVGASFLQLGRWVAMLSPAWVALQCLAAFVGLVMLASGHLPAMFRQRPPRPLARSNAGTLAGIAVRVDGTSPAKDRSLWRGAAFLLMPCGLLHAALLLAVLAGDPLAGAVTMLAFAIPSGLGAVLGRRMLAKGLQCFLPAAATPTAQALRVERIGVRVAGAFMLSAGLLALLGTAVPAFAVWCTSMF